jgi:putative tricarboxylic transport membrane protein
MISALLLGSLLGIVTGLLPGLGLVSGLIIAYSFLQTLDVSNIVMFYISMAAASQYVGSVSALVLQVPGEANSIFALRESKILEREGLLEQALGASAIGSIFGGIGAVLLTWAILPFLEPLAPFMFRSDFKTIVLLSSIIAFIFLSRNNLVLNVFLASIGFLLSLIGISMQGTERTFGIDSLISGIPWFPFILGVMILPQLYISDFSNKTLVTKVKFYWNTGVLLRSTVLGYLGGLVPGISYIIGSKLAWLVEDKISKNSLNRLLAAETANNASAYSMLIPLLLLSVPIVTSEAIILDLANNKGFQFNWQTTIQSGWFLSSIIPIISVNLLVGFIAYKGIEWLVLWKDIPYLHIVLTIILLLSLVTVSNNLILDLITLLISLGFGYLLRHRDVIPVVITFLIGDQLEQNLTRLLIIYNLN